MKKFLLFISVFIIEIAHAQLTPAEQYQLALKDAAIAKPELVTNQLWAITPDNSQLVWNEDKTKILVITWQDYATYRKEIKNNEQTHSDLSSNFQLWVTAAPQVKEFCKQFSQLSDEELNLRLKQYLGLAPDWYFDVFIEMWVNPESLFRPCVDAEITDNQCQIAIPKGFTKTEHGKFFQKLYFDSFRSSDPRPWTGLGYTYDWGNFHTKVGASEFIIKPNSPYQRLDPVKTRDYCSK